MKPKILAAVSLIFFVFTAARQITASDYLNLPPAPYNYIITMPSYFTTNPPVGPPTSVTPFINTSPDNPITE